MPQSPLQFLLLTLLAVLAASELQSMSQQQQLMRMCQDSTVKNACRGLNLRRYQGQSCHDQLLNIVCNVRSLRCSFPANGGGDAQTAMEDPICSRSCKRIFRGCATSELTLIAYVPINEQLCEELPSQLCDDWNRPIGHRDDRAAAKLRTTRIETRNDTETEICQAKGAAQCNQVRYIADIARRARRGAAARSKPVRRRHPFRKSDFREGNFTYAAEVTLVRAGWQMESSGGRPRNGPHGVGWPYTGGYEKLLHLEITRVLYTGSDTVGHILDPGSVQIVVLKSGCACAPLKLNQRLIFVGYNSYLENVWNQVILLPHNSHYKCKIKRCWSHRRRARRRHRLGWMAATDLAEMCDCPCGRAERLKCQDARQPRRPRRQNRASVDRRIRRRKGDKFWRSNHRMDS